MAKKKEIVVETRFGKCIVRDEGDKVVIEIPKPPDLTLEELNKRINKSVLTF